MKKGCCKEENKKDVVRFDCEIPKETKYAYDKRVEIYLEKKKKKRYIVMYSGALHFIQNSLEQR